MHYFLRVKSRIRLSCTCWGILGLSQKLTDLFFAGQSTGPGAPFNEPALTAATNTNNTAITSFMIIVVLVILIGYP